MTKEERVRFTERLLDALPGKQSDIARALGRRASDGTVHRRLRALADEGRVEVVDGEWRLTAGVSRFPELPDGYVFPAHLDEEARLELVAKVREWITGGVWNDSDLELLERYASARQRARHANVTLAADGLTTGGGERKFVHPLVAVAREAERDAQLYEDRLRERHDHVEVDDEPDGDQAGL